MLGPRSFTAQLSKRIEAVVCAHPDLKTLPPEQLAALHVMKFEVLAAVQRACMHVAADLVDKLIEDLLTDPQGNGTTRAR